MFAGSLLADADRQGPLPAGGPDLIAALERSGLRGRGGASFPVGTKWRSVAGRAGGGAVVLANGAEADPLNRKDQTLLSSRPHLVLDGAFLAAQTVGANQVILYVGERHRTAQAALARALGERPAPQRGRARIVIAPPRYVAGEETAAVNYIETGVAVPTATPPRPFERGVDGRPTLIQNVESLARAALVARQGESAGGMILVTVSGAVAVPRVVEVQVGSTVGEAIDLAGGLAGPPRAVLVGGFFGTWLDVGSAWDLRLPGGCGAITVLPAGISPLAEMARMVRFLAGESAAQCGPCYFGLGALAATCERIAAGQAQALDLERLRRWSGQVVGRGACRHPDDAAGLVHSALQVFQPEFAAACRTVGQVAA